MNTSLNHDHPWRGAESFRIEDAAFFRGRDTEISQLLELVKRVRSVVLYGASGHGKTSLLNAGIVPRLPSGELFPVPIRISYVAGAESVGDQIQEEIARCYPGDKCPDVWRGRSAWELLHRRHEPLEGPQPLLIFDQFEELFTIGAGTPQATQLVDELTALIEGAPPESLRQRLEKEPGEARSFSFHRHQHRVLLSIREDYLFGLESLRTHIPTIIHNRYRIGLLTGMRAMDVVMQAPQSFAADAEGDGEEERPPLVQKAVAELIVRTVAARTATDRDLDKLEAEPALLSILCTELARRRSPGTPITKELVMGTRTDIIAAFYERAVHDCPASVRAFIEDELVTSTGFRTSAVLAEALSDPSFTKDVLKRLVDASLLRVIERADGKWLELTHDIFTGIAVQCRALRQQRVLTEQEKAARARRDQIRRTRALALVGGLLVLTVFLGYALFVKRNALAVEVNAKQRLRRQLVDSSLREGRYRDALAQIAAAIREEPDAIWTLALASDLLRRRNWPLPLEPLFPDGPFTALECRNENCAAAYRDGHLLVRGQVSRDLISGHRGYGSLQMSASGDGVMFLPEVTGTARFWQLSGSAAASLPFSGRWHDQWNASDDLALVALPNSDHSWSLWNTRTNQKQEGVARSTAHVPISPDGKWIAYQSKERVITLQSLLAGERRELTIPSDARFIGFDPPSRVLIAAIGDKTLRRWDIATGIETYSLPSARNILSCIFDRDGNHMVAALEGGGVALWEDPWFEAKTLLDGSAGAMAMAFSPDHEWVVVTTRDGVVRFWNMQGEPIAESLRHRSLAFASTLADSELVSADLGGTSARWIIPKHEAPPSYRVEKALRTAWFIDEQRLMMVGETARLEQTIDGDGKSQAKSRAEVALSRDGRYALNLYTTGLFLQPQETGAEKVKLVEGDVSEFNLSAHGERVAVLVGNEVQLYEAKDHRLVAHWVDARHPITQLWMSADGRVLATAGTETRVTLWKVDEGGTPAKIADIEGLVISKVVFDRRSERVALVAEHQVHLWSQAERRVSRVFSHAGKINDTQFSPDGRWLATGSEDNRARIWEVATGLPASDWFAHDANVVAVDFSPSGRRLLTGVASGEVVIWKAFADPHRNAKSAAHLARLADIVAGHLDEKSGEVVVASGADRDFQRLRAEVERECPEDSQQVDCAGEITKLVREVLSRRPGAKPAN